MSSPRVAPAGLRPADVERWLTELGLEPLERADRDAIVAWDLVLDGRRRRDLRVTLICQPDLGLICWGHYAPPINDLFRKSYRRLLRWNDELPFVKFSIGEDERPEEHGDPNDDKGVREVEGGPRFEVEKVGHVPEADAVAQVRDAPAKHEA